MCVHRGGGGIGKNMALKGRGAGRINKIASIIVKIF